MIETNRLFIAVELPISAKKALAAVQKQLGATQGVRWTPLTQLHLTLQFLGDTPVDQIKPLIDSLRRITPHAEFELELAGIGAFPNLHRPRILWVGVTQGIAEVKLLQKQVIAATQTLGFKPEDRPFSPHLTIGRVQKWVKPIDYANISAAIKTAPVKSIARFSVRHVSLIRSQLKPGGSIYTTLAEIL